ncbi:hypothetical protein D3C72_1523600 [compost metagenome]
MRDSSAANSSAWRSMASARRSSRVLRLAGVVRLHWAKARWAPFTARFTCSNDASGTEAISSPVAGLRMGSAWPSPVTNWPSIKSWVENFMVASLRRR